jgi:hypothetical protein
MAECKYRHVQRHEYCGRLFLILKNYSQLAQLLLKGKNTKNVYRNYDRCVVIWKNISYGRQSPESDGIRIKLKLLWYEEVPVSMFSLFSFLNASRINCCPSFCCNVLCIYDKTDLLFYFMMVVKDWFIFKKFKSIK